MKEKKSEFYIMCTVQQQRAFLHFRGKCLKPLFTAHENLKVSFTCNRSSLSKRHFSLMKCMQVWLILTYLLTVIRSELQPSMVCDCSHSSGLHHSSFCQTKNQEAHKMMCWDDCKNPFDFFQFWHSGTFI